MKRHTHRSAFLPVGIAMALMAAGFTFGAGEIRWFWESQPHVALVLAVVSAGMLTAYVIGRIARDPSSAAE